MSPPTKPKRVRKAKAASTDPFGDRAFVAELGGTKKPKPRAARKTKITTLASEVKEETTTAAPGAPPEADAGPFVHEPPKRGRGRPSPYKPEYAKQAEKLCRLGATDEELADFFGVCVRSIYRWTQAHEDFCQSLKAGKENADERVERSLFHRATGYKHEAIKIFMPAGAREPVYAAYTEHIPPDTTAAIFWLKNRRPELWRDKREVTHSGAIGRAGDLTDEELAVIIAEGGGDGAASETARADDPDRVH